MGDFAITDSLKNAFDKKKIDFEAEKYRDDLIEEIDAAEAEE